MATGDEHRDEIKGAPLTEQAASRISPPHSLWQGFVRRRGTPSHSALVLFAIVWLRGHASPKTVASALETAGAVHAKVRRWK